MAAKQEEKKLKLDLTGKRVSYDVMLYRAKGAAKRAGWTEDRIKAFVAESQSGTEIHFMNTLKKYFDLKMNGPEVEEELDEEDDRDDDDSDRYEDGGIYDDNGDIADDDDE